MDDVCGSEEQRIIDLSRINLYIIIYINIPNRRDFKMNLISVLVKYCYC
jgi:hypothetical protein